MTATMTTTETQPKS